MPANQPQSDRLALGFGLLVALTFGLIVLGALVRAHDAGLACPDWPLCFGEVIPQMDVRVAFEWSHRAVAGGVALLFSALAFASWRLVDRPPSLRRWISAAAVLLGIQIILGALTVWLKLASWTVTAHLITGNGFALSCLLTAMTLRESPGLDSEVDGPRFSAAARSWVTAGAALLLIQFVLGGLVSSRYAGMACPEWPACNGGMYFPTLRGNVGIHLMHRMNGYLLLASFIGAAWACRRNSRLRGPTLLALGLGIAQVIVGIANVLLAIPVEVTGLHSALAAALSLTLAVAMRAAWSAPPGAPPRFATG